MLGLFLINTCVMSWKSILGPDIKKINTLTPVKDSFIFVDDHIGTSMHDTDMDVFLDLLYSNLHGDLRLVVEYIESKELAFNFQNQIMFIPVWAIKSVQDLNQYVPYTECAEKNSIFNFSVNKTRYNRRRLLELLDQYNLTTETYSLCGKQSWYNFKPKFMINKNEKLLDDVILNKDRNNFDIYQSYLRANVFEPSYISLITEPGWYSDSTFITEKTVFAFEAQTIPIWVGGYKQAENFKKIGFDVFDDVVDHSYQTLMRPEKRIEIAIKNNVDLLKDINFLKEFYNKNKDRFKNNRKLIRDNQIVQFVRNEINRLSHWPKQAHIDALKLCNLH